MRIIRRKFSRVLHLRWHYKILLRKLNLLISNCSPCCKHLNYHFEILSLCVHSSLMGHDTFLFLIFFPFEYLARLIYYAILDYIAYSFARCRPPEMAVARNQSLISFFIGFFIFIEGCYDRLVARRLFFFFDPKLTSWKIWDFSDAV